MSRVNPFAPHHEMRCLLRLWLVMPQIIHSLKPIHIDQLPGREAINHTVQRLRRTARYPLKTS